MTNLVAIPRPVIVPAIVLIDLDRRGWNHATNISTDVLAVRTSVGHGTANIIAPEYHQSEGRILLVNTDLKYTNSNPLSPYRNKLVRNTPIQILSNDGVSDTEFRMTGAINRIEESENRAEIVLKGMTESFWNIRKAIPLSRENRPYSTEEAVNLIYYGNKNGDVFREGAFALAESVFDDLKLNFKTYWLTNAPVKWPRIWSRETSLAASLTEMAVSEGSYTYEGRDGRPAFETADYRPNQDEVIDLNELEPYIRVLAEDEQFSQLSAVQGDLYEWTLGQEEIIEIVVDRETGNA